MTFGKLAAILLALLCLAAAQPDGAILIRGALVFDGTGAPAAPADVLISGERIAAVGRACARRAGPGSWWAAA